jgi:hypothetical protein
MKIQLELDKQMVFDVLTTILAHHQQRLPHHLLLFKVVSVSYHKTARHLAKAKRTHSFQVILVPLCSTSNASLLLFRNGTSTSTHNFPPAMLSAS